MAFMTRDELLKCEGVPVSLVLDGKLNRVAFISIFGEMICLSWPASEDQWMAFSPAMELTSGEMEGMSLAGPTGDKYIESNIFLSTDDGKRVRYVA